MIHRVFIWFGCILEFMICIFFIVAALVVSVIVGVFVVIGGGAKVAEKFVKAVMF